jgi:hypothetical protein
MSGFSPRALASLEVARKVYAHLAREKLDCAVIGSIALAVHGYVRATRDLDLAVAVLGFRALSRIAEALRRDDLSVHVAAPAADDDLGGVLTVTGADSDPVQVVNLTAPDGRNGKLARAAIGSAQPTRELDLPVIDLPHLVALKLVTGARKDELDVLEVLRVNPDQPLEPVLEVCRRHRLGRRLEDLLAGARGGP